MATAHSITTGWKVNWGGRHGQPQPVLPIRVSGLHEIETINHYCFNGQAPLFEGFRALVVAPDNAEAALALALQLFETSATVVYWNEDASELERARDLARRHGLEHRIQWLTGPLDALRAIFDDGFHYIACESILDRTDDPGLTFETLRSLLDDRGAIGLSTNGKYGRFAADALRDLTSYVVSESDSRGQKIELAKGLLRSLGPMSWTRLGLDDLPPGVAQGTDDEALHACCFGPEKRAFSIDEIYDLLDTQGLHLVEFERTGRPYYQPFFSYGCPEFRVMVEELPPRDQHTVAELVWCLISRHRLWASATRPQPIRPDDAALVPSFNRYAALAGIDWRRFFENCGPQASLSIRLHGDYHVSTQFEVSPLMRAVLEKIDGERAVGQIISAVAAEHDNAPREEVLAAWSDLAREVRQLDAFLLRHKRVRPLPFWNHVASGRFKIR